MTSQPPSPHDTLCDPPLVTTAMPDLNNYYWNPLYVPAMSICDLYWLKGKHQFAFLSFFSHKTNDNFTHFTHFLTFTFTSATNHIHLNLDIPNAIIITSINYFTELTNIIIFYNNTCCWQHSRQNKYLLVISSTSLRVIQITLDLLNGAHIPLHITNHTPHTNHAHHHKAVLPVTRCSFRGELSPSPQLS